MWNFYVEFFTELSIFIPFDFNEEHSGVMSSSHSCNELQLHELLAINIEWRAGMYP